jgi:hypothetical protein
VATDPVPDHVVCLPDGQSTITEAYASGVILSSPSSFLNCRAGCACLEDIVSALGFALGIRRQIMKPNARNSGWFGTTSEQIAQRQRLTTRVFLKGLTSHPTDDIPFLGETRFPGLFILERSKNLRGNRILLVLGKTADPLKRLFQQPRPYPSLAGKVYRVSKFEGS